MKTIIESIGMLAASLETQTQSDLTRALTNKTETEKTLREQAMLLSIAHDAFIVRTTGDKVTYWNKGAEETYGWTQEEAMGRVTHDLFKTRFSKSLLELNVELAEKNDWQGELIHTRKDGQEILVSSRWAPQRDLSGRQIGVLEINRDITHRKQAEKELIYQNSEKLKRADELLIANKELVYQTAEKGKRAAELVIVGKELADQRGEKFVSAARFESLVKGIKEYAIFLLDKEGHVATWSEGAKAIKGYDEDEIIGQHFSKFYTPEDILAGIPAQELKEADSCGQFETEGWRVRKDGSWFCANVTITPVRGDDHIVTSYSSIMRDLTERKKAETERARFLVQEKEIEIAERARGEAERANRTKDEFLATLSHELRTPLATISGWAQMLSMGILNAEKSKKAIRVIEESAKAQEQLIDDLLDIARIQAGKLKLVFENTDPRKVVSSAIESVRNLALTKSIQIEVETDPLVDVVFADPHRLQQILWNLITNAIKFSPVGGKVLVKLDRLLKASGNELRIQVLDHGRGINPDFLPNIFERFSQADSTTTRAYGGLGLGLSVVRNLVEMHEGTVEVDSPGEGKGAAFTVCLLIKFDDKLNTHNTRVRVEAGTEITPIILQALSVLVVEDQESVRDVITTMLSSYGANVRSFGFVSEALAALAESSPDIIISDIAMPIEDGYSFIRKVRAMGSKVSKTPAIALTAYAGPEDAKHALEAGFQAHMAKPIDVKKLVRTIKQLHAHSI